MSLLFPLVLLKVKWFLVSSTTVHLVLPKACKHYRYMKHNTNIYSVVNMYYYFTNKTIVLFNFIFAFTYILNLC